MSVASSQYFIKLFSVVFMELCEVEWREISGVLINGSTLHNLV